MAGVLTVIMTNIGGPKQPQRELLASVVSSVILCGALIWSDALNESTTMEKYAKERTGQLH